MPSILTSPFPRKPPTVGFHDGLGGALAFKRDVLGFLADGLARHGPIFRFRLLGLPVVVVNHPDYVRHVLVDAADRYGKDVILFRLVQAALRNGLIATADMGLWRRQRRMMAPHFTPRAVTAFVASMTDETERQVRHWESTGRVGDVVDVTDELGRLALRIVTRSLFGVDVGTEAERFERAFREANAVLSDVFRFPFPPLSVPTPRSLRLRRAVAELDAVVTGIVRQRTLDGRTAGEHTDLLGLLLDSVDEQDGGGDGKGMSLEQLCHEVMNISAGSYETTACTFSWLFYVLSRNPEIEKKVHAEVDEVLGGRKPEHGDLPRLAFTRRVVEETLRLYTPAYQFMRRANTDDEIGGYRVPAGTSILISSYFLHRDPQFWAAPERFDPEHFRPEAVAGRPKHSFLPFGAGQRVCIGKHFAMTELVLAVATLARTHRFVLPDGAPEVVPDALITLHPRGGVHLRLERRP